MSKSRDLIKSIEFQLNRYRGGIQDIHITIDSLCELIKVYETCPKCNCSIEFEDKFCRNCGMQLPQD